VAEKLIKCSWNNRTIFSHFEPRLRSMTTFHETHRQCQCLVLKLIALTVFGFLRVWMNLEVL
jgi:hypothetical protein